MIEKMQCKEFEVFSEKYDIKGIVKDYGVVTKLFFTYEGKEVEIGMSRNILKGETFKEAGREILETYISELSGNGKERKRSLHYWYVDECSEEGEKYLSAHGRVSGHDRLPDSMFINSSAVKSISINEETEEAIIRTENSIYHCPLEYCRFAKQDAAPELIPDYESIKEKYGTGIKYPSIEPGKVLLVLANFSDYYFHSIYYVSPEDKEKKPHEYEGWPHVGMFQDSYLISVYDADIELRYFPHFQNIEFYMEETDGKPFFIENVGDVVLFAKTSKGTIRLEPGERKEVKKENSEDKPPVLPKGDLYPAGIMQ